MHAWSDVSPVPFQEKLTTGKIDTTSFAWLEWFGQVRNNIQALNVFRTYGAFANNTNHTLAAVNTPTVIDFDSQPLTDGVTLVDLTKITVPETGFYRFDFSTQLTSSSSSAKNIWFWPRVNGVDVDGSTIKYTISSNSATVVVSRSGIFHLEAGDYLEAWWAADDTNVQLTAHAATSFAPGTPSVLLSAFRIG